MSKDDKSSHDRSVTIGQGATRSVIITGNDNVVNIADDGGTPSGQQHQGVPKVFISSTSEDLKPYRDAAHHAAVAAGFLLQVDADAIIAWAPEQWATQLDD